MLKQFQDFLAKNHWFLGTERGLLALSGGLDSMVLAHLLIELGKDFGVAHCNFKLRGTASDGDQAFVRAFAEKQGIPFYVTSFETETYANEHKLSIQLAARELRYKWLEELQKKEGFDYLMTAHHQNDSMETLLFNLTKGTGIRGLHGIPLQNKWTIRPLLFASRAAIEAFGKNRAIAFREDASNANTKYHRNLIRHEVVPVLKKINPGLEQTFGENIQRFKEVEWLYEYALAALRENLVAIKNDQWTIDLQKLERLPARKSILFEWLRPFGFHPDQVEQVFEKNLTSSGRLFLSPSHELLVNRDQLLLRPKTEINASHISLDVDCRNIALPEGRLEFKIFDQAPDSFSNDSNSAFFDFSHLSYPLTLRRWQAGDVFQPFGMNGKHQKLQDFFNNAKLSRFKKEKVWLLESNGQICWVVGHRLDERFRVGDHSSKVLQAKWHPE